MDVTNSNDETGENTENDDDYSDLFLSKHKSDVMFTFPHGGKISHQRTNETYFHRSRHLKYFQESEQVGLPAHKFVLCKRSAVFHAMFSGPLANNENTVMIEDIEPEVMKELLRFVYCGKVKLNGNNVLHCVNAASKYDIAELKEQCVTFLLENLSIENVCSVLEQANFFHLITLHNNCLYFILENANEVFKSAEFLEMSHPTLAKLVENDKLMDEEVNIFKACVHWSENQCRINSLEINPDNLRISLGNIINQIRFPNMCPRDFYEVVAPTKILTSEEEQEICSYLATTTYFSSVNKFTTKERAGRYFTVETQKYGCYRSIPVFGCHLRLQIQSEPAVCDAEDTLLLKAVTGSFVQRVLRIYCLQRGSQHKVLIENYKTDSYSILFLEPIQITKELNLEFQIFEEHCYRNTAGVIKVITEPHIFLAQRFLEEVVEVVNHVKCEIFEIPKGLSNMTFLK